MDVSITTRPQQTVYGLWRDSGDRRAAKDIPVLSKQYYAAIGAAPDSVLPFFVLSKDYDKASGQFRLFIGGTVRYEGLEAFSLPDGSYAKVTIRPKLGFLWGAAIGGAKRYFYTKWLPATEYSALNMEYEYHTEKSLGKKPEIDLLFAVSERRVTL